MSENKNTKYFKYAIGEIVLVVIGILIALQINNWNENRKERILEKALLRELNKDFISNKIQFDSVKQAFIIAKNASKSLLDLFPFKNEKASLDSFNSYRSDLFKSKGFNPKNGTVESILNTGNIQLIQNDTLRNLVISWKDIVTDYQEDEGVARMFIKDIADNFRRNMDNVNLDNPFNLKFIQTYLFQNLIRTRYNSLNGLLNAIKDEKIEFYMSEIIRLSNTNYD